jgi:hypothetical protein
MWDSAQNKVFLQWTENGKEVGSYVDYNEIGAATAEEIAALEKVPEFKSEDSVLVTLPDIGTKYAQVTEVISDTEIKIAWLDGGERLVQRTVAPEVLAKATAEEILQRVKSGVLVNIPDGENARKTVTSVSPGLHGDGMLTLKWYEGDKLQSGRFNFNDINVVPPQSEAPTKSKENPPATAETEVSPDTVHTGESESLLSKEGVESIVPMQLSPEEMKQLFDLRNAEKRNELYNYVRVRTLRAQKLVDAQLEKFKPGIDNWRDAEGKPLKSVPRRDGLQAMQTVNAFYKGSFTAQFNRYEDSLRDSSKRPLDVEAFTNQIADTYRIIRKQLSIVDESLRLEALERQSREPSVAPVPTMEASEQVATSSISEAVVPSEAVTPENENITVEDLKRLFEEVLEKTGYDESVKQQIRAQLKIRLGHYKNDPEKHKKALMEYFHRLAQDWEYQNEAPLMEADQLADAMEPLNSFLGDPANRQKFSSINYLTLLEQKRKLALAYRKLQEVDEPNPSESDPKTRKNILRKYTNIATKALAKADAIMNTPDQSMLGVPRVAEETGSAEPVAANPEPAEMVPPPAIEIPGVTADEVEVAEEAANPTKAVPGSESTTRVQTEVLLSTKMPIPDGPAVEMIRTEEVLVSENAPKIERPIMSEKVLPLDEKFRALRLAKNNYVDALSKAIQSKTIPKRGEFRRFEEGALRAVETAQKAYDTLFTGLTRELVRDVSSKFAIQKDAEVSKLERVFYDESGVTAERLKNVARMLGKGINFLPEYTAKRLVSQLLNVDILKQEAKQKKAEQIRKNPIFQKPPVAPLPGVTRPIFSEMATKVDDDKEMSFIEPEKATSPDLQRSEPFRQYEGIVDVPDSERVSFPTTKNIGDITDADFFDILRPIQDETTPSFSQGIAPESVPETTPKAALTTERVYEFMEKFTGGEKALADDVEKWVRKVEGVYRILPPDVRSSSFFAVHEYVDPYEALSKKSVADILSQAKNRIALSHELASQRINPNGFKLWADRLQQFTNRFPDIDTRKLPFTKAVAMMYATEELEHQTRGST